MNVQFLTFPSWTTLQHLLLTYFITSAINLNSLCITTNVGSTNRRDRNNNCPMPLVIYAIWALLPAFCCRKTYLLSFDLKISHFSPQDGPAANTSTHGLCRHAVTNPWEMFLNYLRRCADAAAATLCLGNLPLFRISMSCPILNQYVSMHVCTHQN